MRNPFGLIADLLGRKSAVDTSPDYTLFGVDSPYKAEMGYAELAVSTGINKICSGIAQLRATVVDKDNVEQPDHPLLKAVNNPNEFGYSSYHLLYSYVGAMLLYGNGYMQVLRDTGNDPTGFQLLNSPDIQVSVNPMGYPIYRYKESVWYTADDVLQMVDIPTAGVIGPSRVEQAAVIIANKARTDKNIAYTVDKGMHGATMVSVGGDLDEKVRKSIKAQIGLLVKQKAANAVLTFPEGTTAAPLHGPTPADQNLRSYRETTLHEIAAALGVLPSDIGAIAADKFNNALVKQKAFYRETLAPIKIKVDAAFTRLLPPGLFFRLDTDYFLLGDISDQSIHYRGLVKDGIITPNEARIKLGMEELDETKTGPANELKTPTASTADDVIPATGGRTGSGGADNR